MPFPYTRTDFVDVMQGHDANAKYPVPREQRVYDGQEAVEARLPSFPISTKPSRQASCVPAMPTEDQTGIRGRALAAFLGRQL